MKKLLFIFLIAFSTLSFGENLQRLSVILDWFPNPNHAPLIIAKQQGYFKEQGLDVDIVSPADPNDAPKMVAANKFDVGITYEPEFMEQVDKGLPLIRIGNLIDKPLDCLVALKDSGITKISDLKGKRIGSATNGMDNLMLKVLLKNAGLKPDDVQIINLRYNLTQALLSHKIDVVTGMMRNYEVPQLEMKGKKITTFFPEEHGIPTYSVLIFITNKNKVADKRLPKFLSALKKAVRYIDEHPKESWEQFAALYPENNNKLNHEAWFTTMPYLAEDPASFDPEEWNKFAKFMHANNLIKKIQPLDRYAVVLR